MCAALDQQLQRGLALLQVWDVYSGLASSFSQQLQTLQSGLEPEQSGLETQQDHDAAKQLTARIQQLQVRNQDPDPASTTWSEEPEP